MFPLQGMSQTHEKLCIQLGLLEVAWLQATREHGHVHAVDKLRSQRTACNARQKP